MKRIKVLLAVIAAMAMMIVVAAPAMADTFISTGNEDFDEVCCEDEDEDVDWDFLGYAVDDDELVAVYEVEEGDETEIETVDLFDLNEGFLLYPAFFSFDELDDIWWWE